MHYSYLRLTSVCLFAFALSACDFPALTSEEKINEAIPITSEMALARDELFASASPAERKLMVSEYANKLKLRALTCSNGYSPSIFTSAEDIQKKLPNRTCFNEKDAEITKWIGLRHVGVLLSQPPLRDIPSEPSKFIIGDSGIQSAVFARKAGIVLINTHKKIQIIDLKSAKPIFEEQTSLRGSVSLSSNGRVFVSNERGLISLRNAETGAVLVNMEKLSEQGLQWLDQTSAYYFSTVSGKTTVMDFKSGKEVVMPVTSQVKALQIADDQFVVGAYNNLSKIEVRRDQDELTIKLLEEKPMNMHWFQASFGTTSDGSNVFGMNLDLFITSTSTWKQDHVALSPFSVQSIVPSFDPDKIIITGRSPGARGSRQSYLYSISKRDLAVIDRSSLIAERLIYIPSLNKNAAINESRIVILDELPLGGKITLDQFMATVTEEENQRKLEAFERNQQALGMTSLPAASAVTVPTQLPNQKKPSGVLSALVQDSRIEALGVYQAGRSSKQPSESRMGSIDVQVRRSTKPIALVLASYEPVRWNLMPEPGAKIVAVLISGYHESQVTGAGSARVVKAGNTFSYKSGTPEYAIFERDISAITGKRIDLFQGAYSASSFSVGGK